MFPPRRNASAQQKHRRQGKNKGVSSDVRVSGNYLQDVEEGSSGGSGATLGNTSKIFLPFMAKNTVTLNAKKQRELKQKAEEAAERERAVLREKQRNSRLNHHNNLNFDDDGSGDMVYEGFPVQDPLPQVDTDSDGENEVPPVTHHYLDYLDTCDGPVRVRPRRRKRYGARKAAYESTQVHWNSQMEKLATAFLLFRKRQNEIGDDVDVPPVLPASTSRAEYFDLHEACGTTWIRENLHIPHNSNKRFPGESLIALGLLSNVPLDPRWAVSIACLQHYHFLRLHRANYSIQAFLKTLCMHQSRTYTSTMASKFGQAFDVYLEILRIIDTRVNIAMGRTDPDYRLKHACPCCLNILPGERELKHKFHFAIDGGSSLKRFNGAGSASTSKKFKSDYILPAEEVDKWKHVRRIQRKGSRKGKGRGNKQVRASDQATAIHSLTSWTEPDDLEDDEDDLIDVAIELGETLEVVDGEEMMVKNVQGDPTDGGGDNAVCVERWKANSEDAKKGMFSCFDEAGDFVAICRHGILLLMCDMVKSGELAKYPLAILAKIEATLKLSKLLGYDIACAFSATLKRAGLDFDGDYTLPEMHGYGHNRLCQVFFQTLYIVGSGLSDFENCERFFSRQNHVATLTRHSTAFHRHQFMDMDARQSDKEKYENLGKFIFNNYRQALKLIDTENARLDGATHNGQLLTDADYLAMHKEEQKYLTDLKKEPPEDTFRCLYVDALKDLWKAEAAESAAMRLSDEQVAAPPARGEDRVTAGQLRSLANTRDKASERVEGLEHTLSISSRWSSSHRDFIQAVQYANERKYRLALDHLERLVIQRLMELAKCNIQGTNVKLRTHIAKHLKSRSPTIRTALNAYNKAARALGKPTFDFATVIAHDKIVQFDVLRDSRQDVRNKPWAQSHLRSLRDSWFKLRRAREEIVRLDVEIPRLRDWMSKEVSAYTRKIDDLRDSDPPLALELRSRLKELKRMNAFINRWLLKCERLHGYGGARILTTQSQPPVVDLPEVESDDDGSDEERLDRLDEGLSAMDARG